jgi:hypothetical protein
MKKNRACLFLSKVWRGFPNVRLDPFDIKLFGVCGGIKEPTRYPSIRINNTKNKRVVITEKIGSYYMALGRRRRRREINDGLIHCAGIEMLDQG